MRFQRPLVLLLFGLVGLGPWLLLSSLWQQLPVFVLHTPEKWSIAAYIVVFSQFGNVASALFVYWMSRHREWTDERRAQICARAIVCILLLSMLATLLCSLFWAKTVSLGGDSRSSLFIILTTMSAGITGCMSVVLVYPWVASLEPVVTSALSTGMGLNALVASALAIVQDPTQHDRFSTSVFLQIVAGVLALSLASFLVLWRTSLTDCVQVRRHVPLVVGDGDQNEHDAPPERSYRALFQRHRSLCVHQFVICVLQYALLSLFPFAFAGFGPPTQGALLLWSNVLINIVGPLARFSTAFLSLSSGHALNMMSISMAVLSIFLLVCAVRSQPPFLPGPLIGAISVAQSLVFSFEETTLFAKVALEERVDKTRASRLVGIGNQLGAFVGAFLGFAIASAL